MIKFYTTETPTEKEIRLVFEEEGLYETVKSELLAEIIKKTRPKDLEINAVKLLISGGYKRIGIVIPFHRKKSVFCDKLIEALQEDNKDWGRHRHKFELFNKDTTILIFDDVSCVTLGAGRGVSLDATLLIGDFNDNVKGIFKLNTKVGENPVVLTCI